jgi:probable F420-dependent oxidoreductase
MHPFRFGVSSASTTDRADWVEKARRVEDLGYDVLSLSDHLLEVLQPFVAMTIAAEATSRLRVGTLVLNNDLRHPVLLAREAATLDLLTGGRLELGLGAGHSEPEYREAGLSFDPAAVRVARLEESVRIVKALLAGEEVHHRGEHYRIDGHRGHPPPVQQPHPPILLGGYGRRLLRLAAREADIVGFTGAGRTLADGQRHEVTGFAPAAVEERVALVRATAGERLPGIEFHALVQRVIITDDRDAAAAEVAAHLPGLTPADVIGTPFILVGSVDEIVDELVERRERLGFSYYTVFEHGRDAFAPGVARLAGR